MLNKNSFFLRSFLNLITAAILALVLMGSFSATVTAAEIPAGCPGGPPGTPAPNVICPKFVKSDCKVKPLSKENCRIINYIVVLTNTLSAIIGIVVAIMIVVGGIQYSAAADNPQTAAAAKKRISNAVLALVLYLFTFAFLQWLIPGGFF